MNEEIEQEIESLCDTCNNLFLMKGHSKSVGITIVRECLVFSTAFKKFGPHNLLVNSDIPIITECSCHALKKRTGRTNFHRFEQKK